MLQMSLRKDVLVQRDAICRADLEVLLDHVRQAQMTDSLVSDFEAPQDSETTQWVVDRSIRNTQEVHLDTAMTEKLCSIHRSSIAAFINPFYAVEVRDSEPAQILHYGVGGH